MKKIKLIAVIITLALNFYALDAKAVFHDSRVEKWEFFLAPQFTNSKLLQFDNGAEADINERSSLGFGLGYNINSHIELGVLFAASNSNYGGTRIIEDGNDTPQKFTANLYTSSINFDFTYNILSGALTPYLTATIGSTYIDSGIPDGNIVNSCWWDPWWGYICSPRAGTFTSTEFNYGAGVGIRYDFNRKLFIKAGVAQNYLDINSTNTPDFTRYQVIFGLMF